MEREYEELKKTIEAKELNPEDLGNVTPEEYARLKELKEQIDNLPENQIEKLKEEYEKLQKEIEAKELNPEDLGNVTPEEYARLKELEEQINNIQERQVNAINEEPEKLDNSKEELTEEDLTRQTIIEAIEKEKELGDSLEEEKLDEWAKEISVSVNELYEYDQKKFIEKLDNTRNLDEKLELVEQREQQIENGYKDLFDHKRKESKEALEKQYEIFKKEIKEKYNNDKSNGEYVWANFDKVKESRDYIKDNIDNDNDWKNQFDVLMNNLNDLINNPTEETYNEWKSNMSDFVQNANLDTTKITPYLNSYLKNKNKDLNIDDNLNITGLDFQKKKDPEKNELENKKPEKKRVKVKEVIKNTREWFKNHPKIKLLALGLGLALTTAVGLSGLMVINSALWGVVNGTGMAFLQPVLHAVNFGISKVIGLGSIKYAADTGLYMTGAGNVLYQAVAPTIIAGIAKLGITIPIAKKITDKVKDGWKNIKKPKETVEIPEKEEEKEIEEKQEEPTIEKEKDKVVEKESEIEEKNKQEDINKENVRLLGVLKGALQQSEKTNQQLLEQNREMNEKINQMFKILTPEQRQLIQGNEPQNEEVEEFSDERKIFK